MVSNTALIVSALIVGTLLRLLCIGRRPHGYPPGPPTIPVLGNLHQMAVAMAEPHLQFQEWARKYGPVYSLILGTKVMIVLSNDQVIKDLIDKRSAIYSSRPDLYVGGQLLSGGLRMVMEPYGPTWRLQRKLIHNALILKKTEAYAPYQEIENIQLLFDILCDSTSLLEHFRRYASSMITSIVFGFRWKTFDDPHLQELFQIVDSLSTLNSTGGAAFADFYPILRKLPAALYPIKKTAITHHLHEKKVYKQYYLHTKAAILQNPITTGPCTCADIVAAQQQENLSDDLATYLACTLVEAGSETTSSQLYGFAQAMLLYPSAQHTAQAELDAICGDMRWPTFDDMSRLSYVRACVKETLRWMPAALLGGVPHALTQDDVYMGYRLPAGAMVLLNVWSIHRDAARYPTPEQFLPERFLGDNTSSAESAALADVSQRDHFAFGAGRRICSGMHIVDRSLFLVMARMLWAFSIEPQVGDDGRAVLPRQDNFVHGMAVHPKKYPVVIKPRSEARAAFVRSMWDEAKRGLDGDGQFVSSHLDSS